MKISLIIPDELAPEFRDSEASLLYVRRNEVVRIWSFKKMDKVTERSTIEQIRDDYNTINRFRKERGTAEVEV